jgi:tRNA G18 (ribose-2'-O)-methylase SpoU
MRDETTSGPRGFCAIGVWHAKTSVNIGTLVRSARILGADFVFTIGRRYKHQSSECKHGRHIPILHFDTTDAWRQAMPANARLVAVELADGATNLVDFDHPQRAIYLLGAEDHGLTADMMRGCQVVRLDGDFSLNVAVAGSIVLYDRAAKGRRPAVAA